MMVGDLCKKRAETVLAGERRFYTVCALVAVGRIGTEKSLDVLEQFESVSDFPFPQ